MIEQKKMKDVFSSISDGDHLSPPKTQIGIPFITISNIEEHKIDFNNVMYVSEEYYNKLSEIKKARKGDILYSVVGTFGKIALVRNNTRFVFQRHIAILRPNNDVDPKYLYYYMANKSFYKNVERLVIGCSQKTLTLNSLRNMEIRMPRKEYQFLIGNILSNIDSKIISNNKINDNLYGYSLMVA